MPKTIWTDQHTRLRDLLKAKRQAQGLTQAQVAEKLKRPQSFVAKFERGERRIDVIEFLQLADLIGFDPHEMLDALKK